MAGTRLLSTWRVHSRAWRQFRIRQFPDRKPFPGAGGAGRLEPVDRRRPQTLVARDDTCQSPAEGLSQVRKPSIGFCSTIRAPAAKRWNRCSAEPWSSFAGEGKYRRQSEPACAILCGLLHSGTSRRQLGPIPMGRPSLNARLLQLYEDAVKARQSALGTNQSEVLDSVPLPQSVASGLALDCARRLIHQGHDGEFESGFFGRNSPNPAGRRVVGARRSGRLPAAPQHLRHSHGTLGEGGRLQGVPATARLNPARPSSRRTAVAPKRQPQAPFASERLGFLITVLVITELCWSSWDLLDPRHRVWSPRGS